MEFGLKTVSKDPSAAEAAAPRPVTIWTPDPHPSPPEGKEPLAGLRYLPLAPGSVLEFEPLDVTGWLVLRSAFDKRQFCRLELRAPDDSWRHLLDADFCSLGQRFHVAIPRGINRIAVHPVSGDPDFWVLADEERLPASMPMVWPAVSGINRMERFLERLESDAVAEFGWMGGCILEAFERLAEGGETKRWLSARDRWLSHFLDDQHLRYQNRVGEGMVDAFVCSETVLPMASIARREPLHSAVDRVIDFAVSRPRKESTCEGCFTLAYPLVQIGVLRDRSDLIELARQELLHRRECLFHDGSIFLRFHGTHRSYRDWARGVGWYLLGHAECLRLGGGAGEWVEIGEHLAERAIWALGQQRSDGLWSNFFYEPELPPDAAGSAGIAAALLKAHRLGLIGPEAVEAARRCWDALQGCLFVDGWLGWTSPSNKRNEGPQHLPRLTSETFGMGLMGLLAGEMQGLE